jgi:hypothetical protein
MLVAKPRSLKRILLIISCVANLVVLPQVVRGEMITLKPDSADSEGTSAWSTHFFGSESGSVLRRDTKQLELLDAKTVGYRQGTGNGAEGIANLSALGVFNTQGIGFEPGFLLNWKQQISRGPFWHVSVLGGIEKTTSQTNIAGVASVPTTLFWPSLPGQELWFTPSFYFPNIGSGQADLNRLNLPLLWLAPVWDNFYIEQINLITKLETNLEFGQNNRQSFGYQNGLRLNINSSSLLDVLFFNWDGRNTQLGLINLNAAVRF